MYVSATSQTLYHRLLSQELAGGSLSCTKTVVLVLGYHRTRTPTSTLWFQLKQASVCKCTFPQSCICPIMWEERTFPAIYLFIFISAVLFSLSLGPLIYCLNKRQWHLKISVASSASFSGLSRGYIDRSCTKYCHQPKPGSTMILLSYVCTFSPASLVQTDTDFLVLFWLVCHKTSTILSSFSHLC